MIKIAKKYSSFSAFSVSVLLSVLLVSCGEDRTHEYEEKTAADHWIFSTMQDQYLWGSSLTELAWKDYFLKPTDFFKKITAQAPVSDKWSWCAVDTVASDNFERGYFNHLDSYGMDLTVLNDPTGQTSRQYGRVVQVVDGSPAAEAGLTRGDFIGVVDGTRFTSAVAKNLLNGKSITLEVSRLGTNEEDGTLVWAETEEVELSASRYVEDVAFPIISSFVSDGQSIAYIMCNRLTSGSIEKDAQSKAYEQMLHSGMSNLAGTTYDKAILDLRLCNNGTLEMANQLASYFVGESGRGAVFAQTVYNANYSHQNAQVKYDEACIGAGFNYGILYVITSAYTSGAAEWLIRALRLTLGADRVVIVGQATAGQMVMTGAVPTDYYVTLHPAVCYVADAEGNYADGGLTPDVLLSDNSDIQLYPFGSEQETFIKYIIENSNK